MWLPMVVFDHKFAKKKVYMNHKRVKTFLPIDWDFHRSGATVSHNSLLENPKLEHVIYEGRKHVANMGMKIMKIQ